MTQIARAETLAELRVNPNRVANAIWNDSWVALTSLGFARGHAMGTFDAMVRAQPFFDRSNSP